MRRYTLGLRGREIVVDVQEIGADRFDVVVGGERYAVSLTGDENLAGAAITPGFDPGIATPSTLAGTGAGADAGGGPGAAAPVPPKKAGPAASSPASRAPSPTPRPAAGGSGGHALMAPMPGTILQFHVKVGDTVARGQPVAVLEAMKMHNTIGAPRAGVVSELCVEAGQAVGHGDPIVRFQA